MLLNFSEAYLLNYQDGKYLLLQLIVELSCMNMIPNVFLQISRSHPLSLLSDLVKVRTFLVKKYDIL